ncbi:carbamoyl-phosphate synthase large subunit [Alkalibacter rhizosphaerae]|uniref:Carbamoyl phosphate synthase large chain n=1 Tax=Alkalibacter rhizosphaerae TaxID=2815577 RepID=A0A974XFN3_9FIRM|nr:carbamoyl-phosphate synthase large subunit [Alkalibacter rhizosphaerae]QSX07760.1 carbamoyl-phosphate synthase large subunit [Alkalibacter rhizosphaerae]
MPKREDIKKVLVIGSGPIVIGQAAEFDYSGAQACQSLKEEGVEVVLVNSNPATIMTDREVADKVYIEPITLEYVEKVIARERPDSLLAGMGGQTGLNMAIELYDAGILDKYGIKVIGTSIPSIKKGEDREEFRALMEEIGQPVIESITVGSLEDAKNYAAKIGYPVVVRPAYTLGGSGGGIADTEEELLAIAQRGLQLSRVRQVLVEKSIKGWKEIEYEVMRDAKGNCITVCNMENIDPVGIHTGDSIVVAPSQTLGDKEYQMLRKASLDILEAVGIEGGCNVQLALDPHSFQYAIIEINPRVSRSSALASKATGYPIAKVAAKIALGLGLDEIENAVTKKTFACFEPSLDYVVIKIPKWPFDKFYNADRKLGTKMMATGEIMAIGNNFESAFLKGLRSLEIKKYALDHADAAQMDLAHLKEKVMYPNDERMFYLAQLLRLGYDMDKLSKDTGMDMFFLDKIKGIVDLEEELKEMAPEALSRDHLFMLKQKGFSDKGIADLIGVDPNHIYELRQMYNMKPSYKMVDTCAGEFEAMTPYYYSTYDEEDEVAIRPGRKVVVIGSGPIRIGQGIEFDYCTVHCVKALREMGIETIVINNNPETVSTDFNISDKLYFEPLTEEDTLNIIEKEKPDGVILQFGGQTAIKLAKFFQEKKVPILGTGPRAIDESEDREKFEEILEQLDIARPRGKAVWNLEEGVAWAGELTYPVLVRPSYVLGGQGMEICHHVSELEFYLKDAFAKDHKNPVLIDKYIDGMELEVDAICDGEEVLIPGIMEHLERAGIHSGDSISIYPPIHVSSEIKEKIEAYTRNVAKALRVKGMINIQFIEKDKELYIIEVNPRSSRTVPYISKVTGLPVVDIATRVLLGEKLDDMAYGTGVYPESNKTCVKIPVFSTEKLPKVEASLGPEMRSTGEVLGVGVTYKEALYKGFIAAGMDLSHRKRNVVLTLRPKDKEAFMPLVRKMADLDYTFYATENTAKRLAEDGIEAHTVHKIKEGYPTIIDTIREQDIDLVFNTPTKGNDAKRDGFAIRRTAIEASVELISNMDKAVALIDLLHDRISEDATDIYELSEYGK